MANEVNPYQVIADTLMGVPSQWPPLLALLGLSQTPPEQLLKLVQSGDQPSFRIRPYRGGGVNFKATSTSSLFVQNFELGLWSMSEQDDGILPINFWELKWETMKAFNEAMSADQVLGLKEKGVNATSVKFLDISEDDQNEDYNRGDFGWVSLIVVSIGFTVKTSSMEQA